MYGEIPPLVLTRSGAADRARSRSSQPFEKAPRSIVNSVYDRDGRMSSQKSVKLKTVALDGLLAVSALPFFLELKLSRTDA